MKTVFSTVIYKQAKSFIPDFIKSVDNQSDKDFDLLIINDNFNQEELADIKAQIDGMTHGLNIHVVDLYDKHLSIAGTRIQMIAAAKELGYDLMIIGDVDDTFSPNRVEEIKNACKLDKSAVFFYNKLVTDSGKEVFSHVSAKVDSIRQISQGNFIGMSTSAIRLELITEDFILSLNEGDCPVFDWYLFSRILLDVGYGILVPDTSTIYRIYDNNEVGVTRDIKKELEVKRVHYKNLAKRYEYFDYLLAKLKDLDIDKVSPRCDHQGFWWSDIQLEDDYEI